MSHCVSYPLQNEARQLEQQIAAACTEAKGLQQRVEAMQLTIQHGEEAAAMLSDAQQASLSTHIWSPGPVLPLEGFRTTQSPLSNYEKSDL